MPSTGSGTLSHLPPPTLGIHDGLLLCRGGTPGGTGSEAPLAGLLLPLLGHGANLALGTGSNGKHGVCQASPQSAWVEPLLWSPLRCPSWSRVQISVRGGMAWDLPRRGASHTWPSWVLEDPRSNFNAGPCSLDGFASGLGLARERMVVLVVC